MELAIIIWLLSALICYMIVKDRAPDKVGTALLLGFLLGPLGVFVTLFLADD